MDCTEGNRHTPTRLPTCRVPRQPCGNSCCGGWALPGASQRTDSPLQSPIEPQERRMTKAMIRRRTKPNPDCDPNGTRAFEWIIESVSSDIKTDGTTWADHTSVAWSFVLDVAFKMRRTPQFRLVDVTVIERLPNSASATTRRYRCGRTSMVPVDSPPGVNKKCQLLQPPTSPRIVRQ